MGHLGLFAGRDNIAVAGIDGWCELLGLARGGLFGLHLLYLSNLCHAETTAIEGNRGFLALAAGHGGLFLAGERLAFAGNAKGLERAKDRVGLRAGRHILLDRRCIRLALIAAIDHIAVRELGADLTPLPLNGRPRQRDTGLLRNHLRREQITLLPALPPSALAATKLRAWAGLAIIVISRCGHPVPFVLGIGVTGKDHILEWQGGALPFRRHLQRALVASERISPQLTTLHALIETLPLISPLDLGSYQLLH
ncbi:hypothetical protein D3C71_1045680 [compost metagenome]